MTRDLIDRAEAMAIAQNMNNGETAKAIARAIAALPAVTVGVKPLRYVEPHGETIEQMRDHARQQPVARDGDMVLVWVNEGDLYEHAFPLAALDLTPAPVTQPDPPAIREAALREAAALADQMSVKWWSEYKDRMSEHCADPHYQGMSDGADEVGNAILALIQKEPTDDSA